MEMGNEREDFFAHLLSEKASDLSLEFLAVQANTFCGCWIGDRRNVLGRCDYCFLMSHVG
jgi:hypothetical protein